MMSIHPNAAASVRTSLGFHQLLVPKFQFHAYPAKIKTYGLHLLNNTIVDYNRSYTIDIYFLEEWFNSCSCSLRR